MIQSVFISRGLQSDSPIYNWAVDNGVELIDFSLITIQPVLNEKIPASDWIFFLSPAGVNTYLDHYELKAEHIAVYGEGTNRELNKKGFTADFVGDNKKSSEAIGEAFFANVTPNAIVLFPVSNISKRSIVQQNKTSTCHEVVIYKNHPAPKRIDKVDIAILTSPSNIDAYVICNDTNTTKFIVLGETSMKHFVQNYVSAEVFMTKASTEEAVVELLKTLYLGNLS